MAFGPTIKIVCTQDEYDTTIKQLKLTKYVKSALSTLIMLLMSIICSSLYNNRIIDEYLLGVLIIVSLVFCLYDIAGNIKHCARAIELVNVRIKVFNSLAGRELYCFITIDKPNGTDIIIGDRKNGGLYLRYFVEEKLPRLGKEAIIFLKVASVAIYPGGLK